MSDIDTAQLLSSGDDDRFLGGWQRLYEDRSLIERYLPLLLFKSRHIERTRKNEDDPRRDLWQRIRLLIHPLSKRPDYVSVNAALDLLFGRFWRPSPEDLAPHLHAYEAHRAFFEAHLNDNADFVKCYADVADYLVRLSDFEKAYPFLRIVVDSPFADLNARLDYCNTLVVGHLKQGRHHDQVPRLIEFLNEATKAEPKYAYAYFAQMGTLYDVYMADKRSALNCYYKSKALSDTYTATLNNLAWLQFSFENKPLEAYSNASRAVDLTAEAPKATYLHTLATLELRVRQNPARAAALARKALQVNANHTASIELLAEIDP